MKRFLTKEGVEHFSEFFDIDFLSTYIPPKRQSGIGLYVADLHLPFGHKKLINKTVSDNKNAESLYILGDLFDMYSMSHYRKTMYKTFKEEFREAYLEFSAIAKMFPKVKLQIANHDGRFAKWLYDNSPKEMIPFCHYNIIEELITLLPNVEIVSQKIQTREVGYLYQYKNVIFTHIEKSSIVGMKVVSDIHSQLQAKWKKLYNLKDYDVLIQAHNHSAGTLWVDNVLLIQIPCLIDITEKAFDYVFDGKFKGNPPALGYVTAYETNNRIDPDSIKLKKFTEY
jgi:hypothetical protein